MEPLGKPVATSTLENRFEEHSESSTTDDTSGIYQYYPHLDYLDSTRKVKSRLGKRGSTLNPFRLSSNVTGGDTSEIDHSKSSAEDSCSDVLSREILVCPSTTDKADVKTKNVAVLDQENYPVSPPPLATIERHSFRNVSNSMKNINSKVSVPFSQEKAFSTNISKMDSALGYKDYSNSNKTDGKMANIFHNNNPSQIFKTPLKQNTDNIFTGSAKKLNPDTIDQPNSAKNLFGPKYDTNAVKENVNSFDFLRTTKKSSDVFSSALQNGKRAFSLSNKFESQNHIKVKHSESHPYMRSASKATSLEDLPLDLKLKLKSERSNNINIFSSSKTSNDLPAEARKESPKDPSMKLGSSMNSDAFINILNMPSVQRNQDFDSPPKSVISKSLSSHAIISNFKEPAVPTIKLQSINRSPQEPVESESYSALNLSMDNCLKTNTSQANSSINENKISPSNLLNMTDINTASFIPNSNSSFLLGSENVSKGLIRNDLSSLSSGSDNSSSSMSQNMSVKNPTFDSVKAGSVANLKQEEDEVLTDKMSHPSKSKAPTNVSLPSTLHHNAKVLLPSSNKTTSSRHSKSELPNAAHQYNGTNNAESQISKKDVSSTSGTINGTYQYNVRSEHGNKSSAQEIFKRPPESIVAVKNNISEPIVQPKISASEHIVPLKMSTSEPIVPLKTNTSEPIVPLKTNTAEPIVPLKTNTAEPIVPLKTNTAEPIVSLKTNAAEVFKKPAQPSLMNVAGSGIPVAVSQASAVGSNFVLPKVNPRPPKPAYSFASDAAKFCRKEGEVDTRLNSVQGPPPQQSSFKMIKVNNKFYHILSTLGRGGSSEVYQVLNPSTNALLAVKCVKLASVDESIAEGYMNEVKLLEKLQGCSSVIRMFDYEYFQDSKKLFVVMEKGDIDLSRLLKDINKMKKISISKIIGYWEEMLTAVHEIHEKGIIHSDLKPANFLLVSGRLKLIDFGIASSLQGDMTSVHKDICAGTENYMSPEAIQGGAGGSDKKYKISYKSDVWSLGCILYNMLYGKTPFSHITSRWSKMYAIISSSHKIEFPDHAMPPVLRSALQSCLIRDPKERISVKDLLDLPYHEVTLPTNLPLRISLQTKDEIQQNIHKECWLKIAHLFAEPGKPSTS